MDAVKKWRGLPPTVFLGTCALLVVSIFIIQWITKIPLDQLVQRRLLGTIYSFGTLLYCIFSFCVMVEWAGTKKGGIKTVRNATILASPVGLPVFLGWVVIKFGLRAAKHAVR